MKEIQNVQITIHKSRIKFFFHQKGHTDTRIAGSFVNLLLKRWILLELVLFFFFCFALSIQTEKRRQLIKYCIKKRICKIFIRSVARFFGFCASIGAEKQAPKNLAHFIHEIRR